MSLRVNHNTTSLSAYSNLARSATRTENSIAKLSSGLRINTAADDAAGLAISEKMRGQVRGLNRARANAQDGVSMVQTAEGGLNETESILQRMRELAVQGSNDTLTSNDRLEIQKEINQLRDSINDISSMTEFNTKKLLNGNHTGLISSNTKSVSGIITDSKVNGGDFNLDFSVIHGGISQMQQTQMFMEKDTDKLASGSTRLEDIAQFYDENGVFALESPQQLTINGNAKSSTFTINGKMTLNELASTLQNAISGTSNLNIRNSSASVISTTQSNISGLGGYIQMTSGIVGENGDFSIAGDQKVMDALGISVSRQSVNNVVQVKSTDLNGNVRNVNTSHDRASGLIDGVDVLFDSTAAQIAGNGGIVDGIKFDSDETLQFKVSVSLTGSTKDKNISVTFTANSTWSLDNIANKINAAIKTGGINNIGLEASVVDGQIRLSYNPTNTDISSQIEITGESKSLGFVANDKKNGFIDGNKDEDAAIRGISKLAYTSGKSLAINVSDGINAKKAIGSLGSTVSAGNKADLVEINQFLISANSILSTVNARVDEVNGSIAFTSTRFGNNSNNTENNITVSSATTFANGILGYQDGTAKGIGDTKAILRVVDQNPTLQIGANQGQIMGFGMIDMSARALGVDKLDLTSKEGAQSALGKIDTALGKVSSERSKLGAYSNRLDHTMSNLDNTYTNLTDAESRIRDLDLALEMVNFTSSQIMQEAGTAMVAQANTLSQSVLTLLGT